MDCFSKISKTTAFTKVCCWQTDETTCYVMCCKQRNYKTMRYNRSFSYPLYVLSAKSSFKIIKLFQALITFCFFPPLDIPSPAKHPQHARASFACHELVALKFAVETYSEQALLFGRVNRVARERASERRSFACPNRRACSQTSRNPTPCNSLYGEK